MSFALEFVRAEVNEDAMRHAILEHSIEEIDEAGRLIIDPPAMPVATDSSSWSGEDWANLAIIQDAFNTINNFRSAHNFPLNTFQTTLRDKARKVDPQSVVAQRVKRLPTIVAKLARRKLKLSDIQDIGGCRAILSSVSRVEKLVKMYEDSDLKHLLLTKDDYVLKPKVTGYRGIHLVYSYYSDKKATYNGLKIEIQFRSALQHAWATAVETVGHFTEQALKSNQGNRKWKRFFVLMGSAIALRERRALVPNTPDNPEELAEHIRRYVENLGVIPHLHAFSAALKHREEHVDDAHYFLLKLTPKDNQVLVTGFKVGESEHAQRRYQEVEKELSSADGDDVVLVSTSSMDALRRAYPNYFLDTHFFIEAVNAVLEGE